KTNPFIHLTNKSEEPVCKTPKLVKTHSNY
ncbi:hypothetical protein VCHENC02_4964B, partial [Vibrio harveyi]